MPPWIRKPLVRRAAIAVASVIAVGYALPEDAVVPVAGATPRDWNPTSFWHEPWGVSGVHKGIDIFGATGQPVVAAVPGVVMYAGRFGAGGNVVAVLGPKWRLHYYAHLHVTDTQALDLVARGERLGSVGTSGNAAGKPPHLHYGVRSVWPLPWRATTQTQGWQRMFYIDPNEVLLAS